MTGSAWGDDFDDPVGCPGASPVGQLVQVADHTDVRLDYTFAVVRGQLDGKRGWIDFSLRGIDHPAQRTFIFRDGQGPCPDGADAEEPYRFEKQHVDQYRVDERAHAFRRLSL